VLGLVYAFLGLRVARIRRANKIGFGDGDNLYLRSAIRAHAHFAEYVPIIVIMNALLEIGGAPSAQMHVLLWGANRVAAAPSLGNAREADDAAIRRRPGRGDDFDRVRIGRIRDVAFGSLRAFQFLVARG
jgi:uncharacterized membrane protein YecN with MAPEG domain